MPYVLHSIAQPHDLCGLSAGLSLRGEQHDLQVSHIGEIRVDLLFWIHKVLNLSHGALSASRRSLKVSLF